MIMIPGYREPHPWLLKHKQDTNRAFWGLALVLFAGLASGPDSLKTTLFVGLVLEAIVYSRIMSLVTPHAGDYHDYLETRAYHDNVNDGLTYREWLESVNTGFRELWKLDTYAWLEAVNTGSKELWKLDTSKSAKECLA